MPFHIVVNDCTYACVALASFSYADEMMPKVGNLALLKLYNRSHTRLELASLRKAMGTVLPSNRSRARGWVWCRSDDKWNLQWSE